MSAEAQAECPSRRQCRKCHTGGGEGQPNAFDSAANGHVDELERLALHCDCRNATSSTWGKNDRLNEKQPRAGRDPDLVPGTAAAAAAAVQQTAMQMGVPLQPVQQHQQMMVTVPAGVAPGMPFVVKLRRA